MIAALYRLALRVAGLAERRCAWCGRRTGWVRDTRGRTAHGICRACVRRHFPQPQGDHA